MALKSVSYRSNTERKFERKVVENGDGLGFFFFSKNGLKFGKFLKKKKKIEKLKKVVKVRLSEK